MTTTGTPVSYNPADHNIVGGVSVTLTNSNTVFTLTAPSAATQTGIRALDGGFVGGASWKLFYSAVYTTVDNNAFTGIGVGSLTPVPLVPSTLLVGVACPNGFQFFNGGNNGGGGFTYTAGDVIDTAVNLGLLLIWWRKNGGAWQPSGDPALGTGGRSIANLSGLRVAPYMNLGGNSTPVGKWTSNWGSMAYTNAAPAGYDNWTINYPLSARVRGAPEEEEVWRPRQRYTFIAPPTSILYPPRPKFKIDWPDDPLWRVPRPSNFGTFSPPPPVFGFPYTRPHPPDWREDLSRWFTSRPVRQSLQLLPVPQVSQLTDEGLVTDEPLPRVSQLVNETMVFDTPESVRVAQLVLEVLVPSIGVALPATYPTLQLGFSVMKRPLWGNSVSTAGSGREVRLGYWEFPLWEWDLTYEYLPDYPGNGITPSDLKTLMGFDLATQGLLLPFLFLDPDDNVVTAQPIGTTDGLTTIFTVFRTYGIAPNVGTEPVGYLNMAQTFNVYLNGVLQSPSSYTVLQTLPVNQQIKFNAAPSAGQVITVDCSYYYYSRIGDDKIDFEKFLHQLWLLKKITLRSLRG